MQSKEPFNVSIRNEKNTKTKEGQKGLSLSFLDPSSPRLASGSPGPPNYFKVKEPARLGEPVTLGVSISSPGRAAIAPSAHFPINRCAREDEEKFQGSVLEGIERIKKEEEEEERRGNEAEALPNHDCDQSLDRSSFGILCATVG